MSRLVMGIGFIVLIIGTIGLFGWIYTYMHISSSLSTLSQIEGATKGLSSLPLIGSMVNSVTTPAINLISSIRTSITLFFYYNILVNMALVLNGIALIASGHNESYTYYRIEKIRNYLSKQKEKEKTKRQKKK